MKPCILCEKWYGTDNNSAVYKEDHEPVACSRTMYARWQFLFTFVFLACCSHIPEPVKLLAHLAFTVNCEHACVAFVWRRLFFKTPFTVRVHVLGLPFAPMTCVDSELLI